MTELSKSVLAYLLLFVLLGAPLIWAILAMRRQIKAGNLSRGSSRNSLLGEAGRRSFLWGVLVATLLASRKAFAENQDLGGVILLVPGAYILWHLFRHRRTKSA